MFLEDNDLLLIRTVFCAVWTKKRGLRISMLARLDWYIKIRDVFTENTFHICTTVFVNIINNEYANI